MFKYAEREAIKFDQSLTSNGVNGTLVVENIDFEGCRFFSGTGDTVAFCNGQVFLDCQATDSTQSDFDVAGPVNFGALMTADWGAGMPEGEYAYSAYLKSNFAGTVYFTVTNTSGRGSNSVEHHLARRPLAGPAIPGLEGEYQRLWFSFYHPAVGTQRIGFVMYQVPPNALLYAGLFAIHRGMSPAPYKQPANKTKRITFVR